MKVALALNTRDKPEQVAQVLDKMLSVSSAGTFDLFWFDASTTKAGLQYVKHHSDIATKVFGNVIGGPDYAAVFALSTMLADREYTHVGLIEDDILFTDPSWFERTMELFGIGKRAGLAVGAASARCYRDRILVQRDGYALMHNLGYGMIILTREAAQAALNGLRTSITIENRRTFAKLSGLDIGEWWAFRDSIHMIMADWGLDRVIASQGFASLALTPSPVEMLNQTPPLEEQGLVLVTDPIDRLRNDGAFMKFVSTTGAIRSGYADFKLPGPIYRDDAGQSHYYPHQFYQLNQTKNPHQWKMRYMPGLGPFAMEAVEAGASITFEAAGPVSFALSGGDEAGRVRLEDLAQEKRAEHLLPARQFDKAIEMTTQEKAVSLRDVRVTALSKGVTLYRMQTLEPQREFTGMNFNATRIFQVRDEVASWQTAASA